MWRALCVLLLAVPLAAQAPDELFTASKEQLDVVKTLLEQTAAWNKGDMAAYMKFYKDAPDTIAMLSGPVRGLDRIDAAFRANFPNTAAMGTLDESAVQVRTLGDDYALAIGHYKISRSHKAGGDIEGSFSDVMQKTADGWCIIFSETT